MQLSLADMQRKIDDLNKRRSFLQALNDRIKNESCFSTEERLIVHGMLKDCVDDLDEAKTNLKSAGAYMTDTVDKCKKDAAARARILNAVFSEHADREEYMKIFAERQHYLQQQAMYAE